MQHGWNSFLAGAFDKGEAEGLFPPSNSQARWCTCNPSLRHFLLNLCGDWFPCLRSFLLLQIQSGNVCLLPLNRSSQDR